MADQGKWFKLWESSLDDQDLENLSIHEWFCWARFGTYLKKHGKDGKIRLRSPATALTNLLRLTSFSDVISVIKRFPNYTLMEGQNVTANVTTVNVTYNVKCLNWNKYQGDFSGDRVRKYRQRVTANVTAQEEKRREEKRRDVNPLPTPLPLATSTSPTNGEKLTPRENGTNPRAIGTNPRALGTNPRAMASAGAVLRLKPGEDPWATDEKERMSQEEMDTIRHANLGPKSTPDTATTGAHDDVF